MQPGDEIRDYVLESRIGSGGVGEVWRARHRHIAKLVAIKIIYRNLSQDAKLHERVIREAAAMATLEHRYIVQLYEFFFLNDQPYLVMDYIDGGSLQDRIDDIHRLPIKQVLSVSRDVLSALNFAHTKGIVHRDVKPANILLGRGGHAFITDFGTALLLGKNRTTQYGKTIGTPEYMSPEQIKGGQNQLDHRTDVYSYGCVLYEMFTGCPPYGARDEDELNDFTIMARHLNDTPIPVKKLNPAVDENTTAVVQQALQKDPNLRPGGCAELADLLGVAEETPDRPEEPPPSPISQPSPPPIRPTQPPSPRWAPKVVWSLLLLVCAGLVIFWFNQPDNVPLPTARYPNKNEIKQAEGKQWSDQVPERTADKLAEQNNRRELQAEQRRIAEQRRKLAEEGEERKRQERQREMQQVEEQRRIEEERRSRRLAQEEQAHRKQNRIHDLALNSFYNDFPHLQGKDPEETTQATRWKTYLNCYAVVDYHFFERYPGRRDQPLKKGEKKLIFEWNSIKRTLPACN